MFPKHLNFRQKRRQILIVQLVDILAIACGPVKSGIMMDHQLLIFGLVDVQLEHVLD